MSPVSKTQILNSLRQRDVLYKGCLCLYSRIDFLVDIVSNHSPPGVWPWIVMAILSFYVGSYFESYLCICPFDKWPLKSLTFDLNATDTNSRYHGGPGGEGIW